jgi:hypothetical protein
VSGREEWWKTAIIKKYRLGGRKRCIDNTPDPQPRSQIWKLIRATIPFFKDHLSWIPGNGKLIRLWQDSILGVDITSREAEFGDLKRWLIVGQKRTLFDFPKWNENGNWKEWSLGGIPAQMSNQAQVLISTLKGAAPILSDIPDNRGWGTDWYSIKEGYNTLLSSLRVIQTSTKWKNVWSQDALPKINIFIWSLAHGNIPTRENVMKRGFHGPFNCPLCQNSQDTIQHLLWDCPFSTTVWNVAYGDLTRQTRWPSHLKPCLGNWENFYQGTFRGKPIFKRLWRPLPKYICS